MVVIAEKWASPNSKRVRVPVDESERRARIVRVAIAREPRRLRGPKPYLAEYLKSRPAETSSSLTCFGDERRDILPSGASTRAIGPLGRHRRYGPPADHDCGKLAHRSGQ